MRDYASEIWAEEETTSIPSASRNYAEEIFSELVPAHERPKREFEEAPVKVQRHYEPTGEISTITGKPIQEFVGKGGPGASMAAHMKAGFVDNPMLKMKIYAADRFPELTEDQRTKKYKYQNGEIIFQADDGKWYAENPDLFIYKLRGMLARQPAYLPSEIMGAIGAYGGGFPGAFLGAAGGEAYRKLVGQLAFGEKESDKKLALDLLTTGIIGGAGEVAGGAIVGGARRVRPITAGRKARRMAVQMGKEAPFVDFAEAARIQKLAREKYGVELFDAQTTESRRLIDRINVYADLPETADLVQSAKRIQDEQAYRAVETFFDDLSPSIDALYAGEAVSKQAKKAIDKEIGKRLARAKPFYTKAFAKNTKIDIQPHIQELDEIIADTLLHSPRRKKLLGFRKMLFKKEKIDGKIKLVPEDRIKQLDELKKAVDVYLKPKAGDSPIDNETKRNIRRIKNNILADLDKANPDYEMARRVWGDDSEAIEILTNKTLLKNIADLEGDNVVKASRELFKTVGNSPEKMKKVYDSIYPQNPSAWNAALRVYLEDTFDKVSRSATGEGAKVFNAFYRNTVGNNKQAKILKAAMGDKYKNLEDFADILRRVGTIVRKESTTATRQEIIRGETEGIATGLIRAHVYPLITKRKVLYDKARILLTTQNRRKAAKALLSPTASKHLKRVKSFGLRTERGVKALTTFLSLVYGNEFTEINDMMFHGHEVVKE